MMAARIRRNPTPVVLSRESLFAGDYVRRASDLHPDGDRIIVAQRASVFSDPDTEPLRLIMVTNWVEELLERVGN